MKFNIVLEKAEEGGYNVTVPALDGCFTQGDSEESAILNAKEAIDFNIKFTAAMKSFIIYHLKFKI